LVPIPTNKTDLVHGSLHATGKGKFRAYNHFEPQRGSYDLLPFRLHHMPDDRYLVSNEAGEYVLLASQDLKRLVEGKLEPTDPLYADLSAAHFLYDETSNSAIDLLAVKVRTKRDRVADFTSLHMFVLTLRCNQSCPYCQVSRQSEDRAAFDMSEEHIDKALDFAFRSPSPAIKFEFQGGESLLNMEGLRHVVTGARQRNRSAGKAIEFVAATNLTSLSDETLEYFKQEDIHVSTSLDGPQDLHNENRPYKGKDAFGIVRRNIERARRVLGPDSVSALMTTTSKSLGRVKEIIDKYIEAGFSEVFLRPLSPYGFAIRGRAFYEYEPDEWIAFFKEGVNYILDLNAQGIQFREAYSSIILQKLLSPSGTGFVNLQSPAGVGIAGIIYNYDGAIYGSDEGRMLAEMEDHAMLLGHLDDSTFEDVFLSERLFAVLSESLPESSPMCTGCGLLPYCGADPDYHYAQSRDVRGHKALSGFCQKNMAIIEWLVESLDRDDERSQILRSWGE